MHPSKLFKFFALPFVVCLVAFSGCSSQQVASTQKIEAKAAHNADKRVLTPGEAIKMAEEKMAEAEQENLAFFSPLHLSQGQESLKLAKQYAVSPKAGEPNAAIEAAISAREYLSKGLTNKADVMVYLKEAIAHKRLLQKLNVPEMYPEEYQSVLYGFSELIKLIEEGEPDTALNKQKPLRKKMYDLEIEALIVIHLKEAQDILRQAEENDAERYAPTSYYNAQYKIDSTENYIRTNYRDRNGIKKAGEQALLLAKICHETGIESKKIMNMDSATSEQYVLAQVKRLQSLQDLLEAGTLPPQSIERSTIDVQASIKNMVDGLAKSNHKIAQLKAELEKYSAVTISGMEESADTGVAVLETLNTKDLGDAPALTEDEQGFDSVEYVEN